MGETVIVENWLGRTLRTDDLELTCGVVSPADPPLRADIARRVCRALQWHAAQGRLKLMTCWIGLLRLQRTDLIELRAPPSATRWSGLAAPATRLAAILAGDVPFGDLSGLDLGRVLNNARFLLLPRVQV